MPAPKHLYETFIRATPDEVWAAITRPEFTRKYFDGTAFEADLRSGARHRYVTADGSDAVEGTIEEVDPGRRLQMTWHVLSDATMAEEPPGRVEWILAPANEDRSVTRVTLRHFDLGMSPRTSSGLQLRWVVVLDSMKSLLETGSPLGELTPGEACALGDGDDDRRCAAAANNDAWELLGRVAPDGSGLGRDEHDELTERASAAAYHWRRAAEPDAPQQARAAWLLSRCHVVAGNTGAALRYAQRCASLTASSSSVADFDHAYAHEALARALALSGQTGEAERHRSEALAVEIADDEDRSIVRSDLSAGPWFELDTEP